MERETVEELAELGERAHTGWHQKEKWQRTAAAIKSAVEGPLLEEVERLKKVVCELKIILQDSSNKLHHYSQDNKHAEVNRLIARAESAEADLKAAQEREEMFRRCLADVGISECEECEGRGEVGGWEGGVEGGFVTYVCDVCGGTGKHIASAALPERRLAKHQPCGCVICTCKDDERCHGCGAKH